MEKKHGVNIIFFVFIAILFLTISCTKSLKQPAAGQLMKADRDFSALSEKAGMHTAFLTFIADSGVILRDNAYPLEGRNSLADLYSKHSDSSFVLTWEPAFEKISVSGDLGYTWGYYTSRVKATGEVGRGTYLTIWQKQTGGSWKFIVDVGTDGLPAKSKND
jgi:ketosteroid isomerase-like protein